MDLNLNFPSPISKLEQEQLRHVLANWKLTPATFAHRISRGLWIPSPHLTYISTRVATAIARGNARIILSMPPRHGKSQLVSIYMPAWLLEYIRGLNIILASYGADLAEGFARQVKGIFDNPDNRDLLLCRKGDVWRTEEFTTDQGGYMFAVGLGGAITGRGGDVLILDDYIKEIKEALSPAYRDYIWNWYVTTFRTRLEPSGSIIIIATRWHSDDLIGRLLKHEKGVWEYIELPAMAQQDDILKRPLGSPLFPERYKIEDLQEMRKTMGTVFFQALYQQRPVDETMRITNSTWLKTWPRSQPLPRHMKTVRIWDLAATEEGGDYLTGTKCSYDAETEDFFIRSVFRDQLPPGKVEAKVQEIAELDGLDVDIGIEQEPGAAGKILVEHFANNVLKEFKVEPIVVSKAKVIRAQPFLAAAEDGHVYLCEDDIWNQSFRDEFETFPSSNKHIHDDQIDTAAEAYTKLTGKKSLSASWGRDKRNTGPSTDRRSGTRNSGQIIRQQASFANISRVKGATWGR
jgi:predicted phage terminase large subunit-like protein